MTKQRPTPPTKKPSAEQIVLLLGLLGFIAFVGIIGLGFVPLLTSRPMPSFVPAGVAQIIAFPTAALPQLKTPTPGGPPTATPTVIYNGTPPTPVYTPRATSLPGLYLPAPIMPVNIIDLARIMQGESRFDLQAAYYVGWVARNRLEHPAYGNTYLKVSAGFFGYRPDLQPRKEFIKLAQEVMRAKEDPTQGCLYALSRTDITKLGVPPGRADVTIGEWFFFHTWPVGGR
ncbi:MAG: hypothetical protein FOGNACKC_00648 [Anaerolineae bacterium]|nr:hypothetical protein [Anaerolineae bacterium]